MPNILSIGESIGTTFPLTGAGIGKAMETGELAAAVILRSLEAKDLSKLATFPSELDALRVRYLRYESAERWFARPWLTDLLTRLALHSQHAKRLAEGVLNDTADPRQILSIRALLRMLLS
jgi:flavin-dependent dehydrogenase